MDPEHVMGWVDRYVDCWRTGDLEGVEQIFTPDASYRFGPYEDAHIGHDSIKAVWREDEGVAFSCSATSVAVEGRRAVVRVDVTYTAPKRQLYADLWLLRFADDGRVSEFEEWPFWPGKSHSAADHDS